METSSIGKGKAYIVLGGIGFLTGAIYLALSFRLPFGQIAQPGAAVFPVMVGAILLIASLAAIREGWQMQPDERVELPDGAGRKRVLYLAGLLFGYFLLLPWLGMALSSILFCALLMRILCDLSWVRIVAWSIGLPIALYLIFVYLLKVPMPRGILVF